MATNPEKYVMHFGVRIDQTRPTARINRETYTQVSTRCTIHSFPIANHLVKNNHSSHLILDTKNQLVSYTDAYCQILRDLSLRNFDINMQRFSTLDSFDFREHLHRFAKNRHFHEICDLSDVPHSNDEDGYIYIMVLGEYKQVYIGITRSNLKNRILQHWRKRKELDRLICGPIETSKISIDSFGPLDTTQIYAKPFTEKHFGDLENTEYRYIRAFEQKYVLNRL